MSPALGLLFVWVYKYLFLSVHIPFMMTSWGVHLHWLALA